MFVKVVHFKKNIINIYIYTVTNVMKFTICLLFNVVSKLKTGFSKKKSIYFTLEIE